MLQNSLKDQLRGDSVMLMRIGGAGHDGAEQPGPGTARSDQRGSMSGFWPIATLPQEFMSALPRMETNPNRRE
jgi:hypothetical protein